MLDIPPSGHRSRKIWDDYQKGKEGQQIVARVTLNEVVLD